ncbi:uncharacterized protein LOC134097974 [Sardina pilchardus]|uniref:uncharacterized protein LOC134097974 n=1 Tax=Sardina pilchardus TaxID=27697 RepID=UPI002E0D84ED
MLTAVSGCISLRPCSPDGPMLNKDLSENLPVGSRCQLEHEQTTPDVNSAAKRIVDQFVNGMRTCLETLQCDNGTPKGGCFTGVSTIFQSVEDTVREFFAHVSCKGKVEQLEAQSLCSEVSAHCKRQSEGCNGCAKAVTRKMLMLFTAKSVPADSFSSAVASVADSIILQLDTQLACSGTRDSGESSLVKSEMADKLSSDEFHATVTREVSQVLLKLAQSFTGPVMLDNPPGFSPASDSASIASSLVGTVLDGVRCLMNSPAQDALTQDLKVWSATRDMYGRLQLNLRDFFTKLSSRQRKAVHSASAKEAIGQVLLCIQEELANSSKFQSSDDNFKEITVVIDSLIEDVGMVDCHTDLDQDRPLSSLSGTSEGSWSNWSEESLPEESVVIPEVSTAAPMAADTLVAVNIDLSDLPQDEASACVPHETVVSAVNSITSTFGLQNEESSSRPPSQGHLTSVWKRLEKALSQGHIQSSQDLIEDVYQILLKGRQTVAAAKSASDSALVAMKQAQDVRQGAMVSQIIGMFAQECVRDLFLPCFKLPSSWKSGARAPLRSAAASVSCPGGLSSMARNGEDRAAESPSQILAEVLQVAMNAMVADVMNILSLATRSPMDMEAFLKESGLPGYDVAFNTPDLGLDDKRRADSQEGSTDYSSLVSVLMIRLLSKLQNEDSLSDDMLDQCRELINKVLSELTAALGVSKTDFCPADVNICTVFKVIYNNLLSEYGSKKCPVGLGDKGPLSREDCCEIFDQRDYD